jgi:hypothetical protein
VMEVAQVAVAAAIYRDDAGLRAEVSTSVT